MQDDEEWLDLVDDNDVIVGRQLRSHQMGVNRNFRVVNAFIRNSKGELWVPRRAATKRLFPLCLDASMGGHVGAGEPYELAFRRETEEELALDIDKIEWREIGILTPPAHAVSAFMRVYEIRTDEVPPFNRDDYIEWWWMQPNDLLARIEAGEPTKHDLPIMVRNFYI